MEDQEYNDLLQEKVNEMIFLVCHHMRRPIASASGLYRLLIAEDVGAEEKKRAFKYLEQTIQEMDECAEELIVALEKIRTVMKEKKED